MTRLPRLAIAFLLLSSLAAQGASQAAGNKKALAEAFALFNKGSYNEAAEKAESISATDKETKSAVNYFLGSTYSKLQAFDKAADHLAKAIQEGNKTPGIHYDYGQALFATQKLKEAEVQFKKSIIAKFKVAASAYYVAYILTILDDKKGALDFYQRIGSLQKDPDKVKQSALLQIGELAFDRATEMKDKPKLKQARKALLEGEVLAAYRKARDFDSDSAVAEQAQARINEVESALEQMVERMRNGNAIPRQAYTFLLSQDFTYDTNVVTEAEQTSVKATYTDALIWKTGVTGKYQFNWRKTLSFIPEVSASYSYHSRRQSANVYQNDNISISPALRTKLEHWSGGKPATAQLDLEFNLTLRDYLSEHHLPFYTRYYNIALSERVKWFETGNTTLKLSTKLTEYYNPSKNCYNPMISLTQLINLGGGLSLVNTVSADYLHARDDVNDERNYKYRGSVTFSRFIEKVDFTPSFSYSLKDTMKQKGSRGNETNLAPALGFTRAMTKKIDANLDYTFTKNISKSLDSYLYHKHEVHFGLGYNF